MVDNDEFRRHVPKGFQSASRAVFNRLDPKQTVRQALNAASTAFKLGGCPGLDEVADVIDGLTIGNSGNQPATRDQILDGIARKYTNDRTARAVRVAEVIMRQRDNAIDASLHTDQEIARRFIVDFLAAHMFPTPLAGASVDAGRETFASYHRCRREFLNDLRQSEGLIRLAAELLADPQGGRVKQQRAKRRERDPYADAFLPLTAG